MTVTQRGELTEHDALVLRTLVEDWERAEAIRANVREVVAGVIGRSSYRAVSEATGFSTNTLQRWKREAEQ